MKLKWIPSFYLAVAFTAALFVSCTDTMSADPVGTSVETSSSEPTVTAGMSQMAQASPTADGAVPINADQTTIVMRGSVVQVDGDGVIVTSSMVLIGNPGTYVFAGSSRELQIVIDLQSDGDVTIVLAGLDLYFEDSAPVYVKRADNVFVTLLDGTENALSDGDEYSFTVTGEDEPSATLFSKDDLIINGSGSLSVISSYNDAITSKDDLTIEGGTILIRSVDDGIVGKDSVRISGGDIEIDSGGDAIKSTNDEDEGCGYVEISDASIDIRAGADGIQAENVVMIHSGSITIDSGDDSIHSNDAILVTGGDIAISAGDDGIHADMSVEISGGSIEIEKSYEGIEAEMILISDGCIRVIADDDGINIASAEGTGGMRPGFFPFPVADNLLLTINGGYIFVEARGDGIDVNGSAVMNGGIVVVNGPTANNNGALDYDGKFEIHGGTIVAAGSAGMAQAPSLASTQRSVAMTFTRIQSAGTIVHLEDADGDTVATFAPSKTYQSVVISSPLLETDATYTLYTGGTSSGEASDGEFAGSSYSGGSKVVSFNASEGVTWLDENGVTAVAPFGGMPGRMPAGRPRVR